LNTSAGINTDRFRGALGRFATGVIVVTGIIPGGHPTGITVNAFTSLSLEPPLVLFCLDKVTGSRAAFIEGSHFMVNILTEAQRELSVHFSTPENNRFEKLEYDTWDSGCPVLKGCAANLECERGAVHDGGDHFIVVGKVCRLSIDEHARPLLYFNGGYGTLGS